MMIPLYIGINIQRTFYGLKLFSFSKYHSVEKNIYILLVGELEKLMQPLISFMT